MMTNLNFEKEFKKDKISPNGQVNFAPHDQDTACMPDTSVGAKESEKKIFESELNSQKLHKQQDISTDISTNANPIAE